MVFERFNILHLQFLNFLFQISQEFESVHASLRKGFSHSGLGKFEQKFTTRATISWIEGSKRYINDLYNKSGKLVAKQPHPLERTLQVNLEKKIKLTSLNEHVELENFYVVEKLRLTAFNNHFKFENSFLQFEKIIFPFIKSIHSLLRINTTVSSLICLLNMFVKHFGRG